MDLEARIDRLGDALTPLAHGRTEAALLALTRAVDGLSEAVGGMLHDRAPQDVPWYLAQGYRIHVAHLDRRLFRVDGQEVEVDFYGEGKRDGEAAARLGAIVISSSGCG